MRRPRGGGVEQRAPSGRSAAVAAAGRAVLNPVFLLACRYGSRTVGLSGGRGKRLGLRHTPQVCLSLVPCQQLTPSVHTLMLVLSLLITQL